MVASQDCLVVRTLLRMLADMGKEANRTIKAGEGVNSGGGTL